MAFFSPALSSGYTPLDERPLSDIGAASLSDSTETTYQTVLDISGAAGVIEYISVQGTGNRDLKLTVDGGVIELSGITANFEMTDVSSGLSITRNTNPQSLNAIAFSTAFKLEQRRVSGTPVVYVKYRTFQ